MPTTRRRISRPMVNAITPEAVAAWRAGDYWALWKELRLKLWQMPDWGEDPPDKDDVRPSSMQAAYPAPDTTALKEALLAIAGPPPERWFFKRDDAGRPVYDDDADE